MSQLRASSACLTRIFLVSLLATLVMVSIRVIGKSILGLLPFPPLSVYTSPLRMLLQEEYNALATAFNSVSSSLSDSPPLSKLPPTIDIEFAQDEGAWPAFNKAMHAAFGDKSKGLKIEERGKGLEGTLKTIRWCLKTLEKANDRGSIELVKLWITALNNAADAVSPAISQSKGMSTIHKLYRIY